MLKAVCICFLPFRALFCVVPRSFPLPGLINWFELPVLNFLRAKHFYEKVFDFEMVVGPLGDYQMGFFPSPDGVMGAIVQGEGYQPSVYGPRIYFNCNPDLQPFVNRALEAGGRVIVPKSFISQEVGFCAFVSDTEGNTLAFNSAF